MDLQQITLYTSRMFRHNPVRVTTSGCFKEDKTEDTPLDGVTALVTALQRLVKKEVF